METAPGHIKTTLALAAFEMRMSNNEKVKDLYFKAFEQALTKLDA